MSVARQMSVLIAIIVQNIAIVQVHIKTLMILYQLQLVLIIATVSKQTLRSVIQPRTHAKTTFTTQIQTFPSIGLSGETEALFKKLRVGLSIL